MGRLVPSPGGPLDGVGNGVARWMAVTERSVQNPAYRPARSLASAVPKSFVASRAAAL